MLIVRSLIDQRQFAEAERLLNDAFPLIEREFGPSACAHADRYRTRGGTLYGVEKTGANGGVAIEAEAAVTLDRERKTEP